jgi:competence protein ComEC
MWTAVFSRPDGNLVINVLDTNGGEAVLIQTPTGRQLLINGGASPTRLSEELGRALPGVGADLDWLLVTAVQQRNLAALVPTLERLNPEHLAWAGSASASFAARELNASLADLDWEREELAIGQRFDLGGGGRLQVIATSTRGAVLLLNFGDFRALLPFGIDFAGLEALNKNSSIGRVDALLLADGGFAPLNPSDWLESLDPRVVLLSVASGNADGLPSTEVLAALETRKILRTDQDGWLRLVTDGHEFWVETGH